MDYLAQALMTDDPDLIGRITGCAATQGITEGRPWTVQRIWSFSAEPDWAQRYAAATENDDTSDPAAYVYHAGRDPEVITDTMILAATVRIISAENARAAEAAAAQAAARAEEAAAAEGAARAAEAAAAAPPVDSPQPSSPAE